MFSKIQSQSVRNFFVFAGFLGSVCATEAAAAGNRGCSAAVAAIVDSWQDIDENTDPQVLLKALRKKGLTRAEIYSRKTLPESELNLKEMAKHASETDLFILLSQGAVSESMMFSKVDGRFKLVAGGGYVNPRGEVPEICRNSSARLAPPVGQSPGACSVSGEAGVHSHQLVKSLSPVLSGLEAVVEQQATLGR
jgi:hypothetical protein